MTAETGTTHFNNLDVAGDVTVGGALTITGAISDGSDITLADGKALQTDTTTAHTAVLKAYDVDGTAYKTFATLTNGNTPSFAIAAPSGGTVAIDGAVIGATTAAAATVTTLAVTSTSTLSGDVTIATGKAIKTSTTTAHTALLQAYDVDGTAYKTFATLTNGNTPSFAIAAPSGGTVSIDGATIGGTTPAAATISTAVVTTLNGNTITTGTGTLTLQGSAVATGPATTGTLALISPPPQAGGSALSVTAAMSGQPVLLNTAAGTTITLPAATGTGNTYKFMVSVSATSNSHKILTVGTDYIIGNAAGYTGAGGATKNFTSAAATNRSIQMPFAGTQPSGGLIGDQFIFTDIGSALWMCIGYYSAGTTPTTPFSTATS